MASQAQLKVIEAARDLVAVVFTGKTDISNASAYSGLVAALMALDETVVSAKDVHARLRADEVAVTLPRVWLTYQGSVVQGAYAKRENAIRSLESFDLNGNKVQGGNTGVAPVEVVDVSEAAVAAMTTPIAPEEEDPWTELILRKAKGQHQSVGATIMPILMGVLGPTVTWKKKHVRRVKAIMIRAGWTEVKYAGWNGWNPPPVKEAGASDVKGAP